MEFFWSKKFWIFNLSFLTQKGIVILVYDDTEYSIDSIIDRYNDIKDKNDKIFCVCRNKKDLDNKISLTEQNKINQFLSKNNIDLYFKISCQTFEGIEEMFNKIIDSYLKKFNINENSLQEYYKNQIFLNENFLNNKKENNKNRNCIII